MEIPDDYKGRLFTAQQLTEEERFLAQSLPSQTDQGSCFRCATPFPEECTLPNGARYCRECLLLGRVRTDQALYTFPAKDFQPQAALVWKGELTDWQAQVSEGLCQSVEKRQAALVHAVTGAGKTEMMYQVVADCIARGGAVCLASPRIDVCIELYKRLERDFSCSISLLHGESDPYTASPLVVATTHQLLKFYQAFDLLLIDEVDAFPYVDNPMLYHAVEQACKPDGVKVFLTATSTEELDRQVQAGRLERLSLPRRFHGNPLVVPRLVWDGRFSVLLNRRKLSSVFRKHVKNQRQTGYPLLIFAAEISSGNLIAELVENSFPSEKVGFVSSQTENRLELVEQFRQGNLSILVSTTILERGVTFPFVDVMVLEADHALFTSSSLIQIAGRVGRSMDRPTGELLFFHSGQTKAMQAAVREIKKMNQEAGF